MKTAQRRQWKILLAGATLLFTGFGIARAQTAPATPEADTKAETLASRVSHAQDAPTATEVEGRITTLTARVSTLGALGRTYAQQNPQIHLASYKASLGRFGVAVQSFLNATQDIARKKKVRKDDKTVEVTPPAYDAEALTRVANRVAKAGLRLGNSLDKQVKSLKATDRLVVSKTNHPARGLRSTLSDFMLELQDVPTKNLAPDQLRALNQVALDTTTLVTMFESLAPELSGTRDTIKAEAP